MLQIDPFKFLQEVRAEARKVTWPTRKETTVTTMMVYVMASATKQTAESELLALHEGNFARYQIRPSEFDCVAQCLEIILGPRSLRP